MTDITYRIIAICVFSLFAGYLLLSSYFIHWKAEWASRRGFRLSKEKQEPVSLSRASRILFGACFALLALMFALSFTNYPKIIGYIAFAVYVCICVAMIFFNRKDVAKARNNNTDQ